jgi:DNA-binding transcriptional LysR family regulator
MEIRQLRAFAAVAEHRHFTRAAAELHVAQPALSQQVRRLEAELGVELFRRTSRSVALTRAGELLLPRARAILSEVAGAEEDIQALRGVLAGRVLLGAMQSLGPLDLAGLLSDFHAQHPDVDVVLREDTTQRMLQMLAADELDLAIATLDRQRPPGLAARRMYQEDLVLAVAPGHPLAHRRRLRIADLPADPFIYFRSGSGLRTATEDALAEAGIEPSVHFETNDLPRVRALVSRGLGVAIMPRSDTEGAGPPVAALTLGPPSLRRTVGLVWREARRRTSTAEAFQRFALDGIDEG